jgi:hypothetical protein
MASKQVANLQKLGANAYHSALRAINSSTRLSKIRKMKMIQQLKSLQHPNKSTLQSIRKGSMIQSIKSLSNNIMHSLRKSPRNKTHKSPKK